MKNRFFRLAIIEDDPMVMEVNRLYVEKIGHFELVGVAANGIAGLELVSAQKPDLVILDVFLPDMDGIRVLEEIRRRNIPADVILVTAARERDTVLQAFRYGAVDYIIKPFRFERLQEALDTYRAMRNRLDGVGVLSQEEVDQLTLTSRTSPEKESERDLTYLPKGLNESTLRQVMLYLIKEQRPVSAEEVAEGIGLARVTARRYLDYLEKVGRIQLEVQYGSVGRPVNRYLVHSMS